MAFTNVIRNRKAVSRVITWTTRVTGSQRHYHYHHKSFSTTFAPISCTGSLSQSLFRSSFSTTTLRPYSCQSCLSTTRQQCDTTLREVIDSEIGDKVEDVPESFPFEIKYKPGDQKVRLTRSGHENEVIMIKVQMPGCDRSPILMSVHVVKPFLGSPFLGLFSRRNMLFSVSAYPDKIEITSLSVGGLFGIEDSNRAQNVRELDENFRKALHKYLDIRGINPQLTKFLHEYSRSNTKYVEWLKKVKKCV